MEKEPKILQKEWFHKKDGKILTLPEAYSIYWKENQDHSPKESRISLITRIKENSQEFKKSDFVLDLGSGRQVLEKEYREKHGNPNFTFVSLDIAEIDEGQLLDFPNTPHFKADGNDLPFNDKSISMVVSNMTVDFMSINALLEMNRVLKPKSKAFINLCFSYLDPSLNDVDYFYGTSEAIPMKGKPRFWGHWLREHELLVNSPEEIEPIFNKTGFEVNSVLPNSDKYNRTTWWEVGLQKSGAL